MGRVSTTTRWQKDLVFEVVAREHRVILDTRLEDAPGAGPTPKEMLLGAVSACSGIDVASILTKMRGSLESCEVFAEAETTSEYPAIFKEIILRFEIKGAGITEAQAQRAVHLSMTKYCGVSAMVFQASPIRYEIVLNGQNLGEAKAHFDLPKSGKSFL